MATVKKIKKAQYGNMMPGKTVPTKKGSFEDVMGKSLNSMTPGAPGYRPETAADRALAAKQAADMKKRVAAGKPMKNGGSLSALKGKAKRVGPVDPKGAYTKVQKKTLAGAKGKASLTKDKELGATKMKKGGAMAKCKYGCH
jgi:hypothetical protein